MILCVYFIHINYVPFAVFIYRLCSYPPTQFSLHINQNHLQECVDQLLFLYSELENSDRGLLFSTSWFEIEALHVLITSDANGLYKALQLSPFAKSQEVLKYSFEISTSLWFGNFVRANRLSKKLPKILQFAYRLKFHTLRFFVVEVYERGYRTPQGTKFPLESLKRHLLLDSVKETANYCRDLGLPVDDASVIFKTGTSLKNSEPHQSHVSSDQLISKTLSENVRISELLYGQSL